MDLKGLMSELLGELGRVSKADGVVGTVRDAGQAKVLPLSKISIAFGTAIGDVGGTSKRGNDEKDADAEIGGAGGAIAVLDYNLISKPRVRRRFAFDVPVALGDRLSRSDTSGSSRMRRPGTNGSSSRSCHPSFCSGPISKSTRNGSGATASAASTRAPDIRWPGAANGT